MKVASAADIKARFSAYLKASEQGPVVVTRNGKPVAILLSVVDEEELERFVLAYSPGPRSMFEAARQQIREGGGIPHDRFWKEMERQRHTR